MGGIDPGFFAANRGDRLFDARQKPPAIFKALGQRQHARPVLPFEDHFLAAVAIAGSRIIQIQVVGQFRQGGFEHLLRFLDDLFPAKLFCQRLPHLPVRDRRSNSARRLGQHFFISLHPRRIRGPNFLGISKKCGEYVHKQNNVEHMIDFHHRGSGIFVKYE